MVSSSRVLNQLCTFMGYSFLGRYGWEREGKSAHRHVCGGMCTHMNTTVLE